MTKVSSTKGVTSYKLPEEDRAHIVNTKSKSVFMRVLSSVTTTVRSIFGKICRLLSWPFTTHSRQEQAAEEIEMVAMTHVHKKKEKRNEPVVSSTEAKERFIADVKASVETFKKTTGVKTKLGIIEKLQTRRGELLEIWSMPTSNEDPTDRAVEEQLQAIVDCEKACKVPTSGGKDGDWGRVE